MTEDDLMHGTLRSPLSTTSAIDTEFVVADPKSKGKQTAEEELRASKGKGKMVQTVDAEEEEDDEEDFDEDVSGPSCICRAPQPLAYVAWHIGQCGQTATVC